MKTLKLRDSAISADWWDYTCLPADLIEEAARLTPRDLDWLSRPGFRVVFCIRVHTAHFAPAASLIQPADTRKYLICKCCLPCAG